MTALNAAQPLLSIQHLTKSYPGVRAVDDVSLDLYAGEVHGLVGENGAGKSTLIKILAGAVPKESGEIRWRGQVVELRNVHAAARLGLAFIHQELNLVPYFDAVENIFLGHAYPRHALGPIDRRTMRARAAETLARLGADIPLHLPVSRLAPGQQMLVSIARAFAARADLIVMDEPTAALTDQEIERLFAVIRTLKAQGVGVVYISHRLQEIFTLTDRVTVMRNGRVVTTQPTTAVDEQTLVQWMTGRTVDAVYPPHQEVTDFPLLVVEGLSGHYLPGYLFYAAPGRSLGHRWSHGRRAQRSVADDFWRRDGEKWEDCAVRRGRPAQRAVPRSPAAAYALGLALAPEERRTQGLVLSRPIFENTTLTFLRRFARGGWLLDRGRELAVTAELGARLGLRAHSLRQPVSQLSGGNQQKVVFARSLAGAVKVLLLDEPTRGVDVGAKQDIYRIIRTLTAQGVGVVLVSSELPELLGVADRLIVLREGRQVATLLAAAVDEETVLGYCYGVKGSAAPHGE